MPIILDLSLSGLATAGKAALATALIVGSFKLFAKQYPQYVTAQTEKEIILTGTTLVSGFTGFVTMCLSANNVQSITPSVVIFCSGLLTSSAIDRVCEKQ
ncbi:MAG: hypothetical protein Homavirus24_6 [Homavirus sp.]|uniref:Uncharacterized protein n=1 Tax=Homavirus sp. TaxID=2487769 RepID=A0A3G5A8X8_9VIRU|nr:MAG: hypothetical protein Homavirus24_6 [Homavirus sp.]